MCVCVFFVPLCSGDAVTMECVDKLIRKSGMLCLISGQKFKESDIIAIVRVSVMAE